MTCTDGSVKFDFNAITSMQHWFISLAQIFVTCSETVLWSLWLVGLVRLVREAMHSACRILARTLLTLPLTGQLDFTRTSHYKDARVYIGICCDFQWSSFLRSHD